jgi:glycosyltransferase 2 family protein
MGKRALQILVGLSVAALFLWLSFRDVGGAEIITRLGEISYWWVIPYFLVLTAANLARMERWKMVLEDDTGKTVRRFDLFAGIMYGYAANIAVPRAGEVLRAIVVSRSSDIETTRLFGTVVLERIIDMMIMLFMIIATFLLLITDPVVLEQLFGVQGASWVQSLTSTTGLLSLSVLLLFGFLSFWLLRRHSGRHSSAAHQNPDATRDLSLFSRLINLVKGFLGGLVALRRLQNWPLFVLYTLVIWAAYVAMTYIPFVAFGFQDSFAFGWEQAFVITVVSAVGITLPSPGGIGTYHFMVQQGLAVLYGIPLLDALAYATISHAVNVLLLLLTALGVYLVKTIKTPDTPASAIPF